MKSEKSFCPVGEKQLKEILYFDPIEKLSQNFLIDPAMVQRFTASTIIGSDVIEIGSGPGNLTKGIAQRANKVIGIEIFPDFAEAQEIILDGCPNVKIVNQNALKFDFKKWIDKDRDGRHQVIGNIPFHISEPLLTILAGVSDKLENITLLVGDNLAATMTMTDPLDDRYSKLSFISSIFEISRVAHVPRECFWPVPRTDSDIISLTPREYPENGKTYGFQLKQKIILSQSENLSLHKVLNSFSAGPESGKKLGKDLSHRYERRQTHNELIKMAKNLNTMPIDRREIESTSLRTNHLVDRIQLPLEILSKPFSRLNNQEVRQLALSINQL